VGIHTGVTKSVIAEVFKFFIICLLFYKVNMCLDDRRVEYWRCLRFGTFDVESWLNDWVGTIIYSPLVVMDNPSLRPIIGGVLSNPATRWPDTLGRIHYLRQHPYFLPCATTGFLAFVAFVISFFGLKEVLIQSIPELFLTY
jgi:hypothetical protein